MGRGSLRPDGPPAVLACTDRTTLWSANDRCQAFAQRSMRILAVGDSYMPSRYFAEAFSDLGVAHAVQYLQVDATRQFEPNSPSELKVREYQGSPAELVEHMA